MLNRTKLWFFNLALLAWLVLPPPSMHAQGTAFTYNGSFNDGTNPATGNYDLSFTLFNAFTNGTAFGTVTNTGTLLTNGLFTVTLDFGNVFNGSNYWLELAARTNGALLFTTLIPRQPITPTPYAIFSAYSGTASSANSVAGTNITGSVPLAQLSAAVVTNLQDGLTLGGGFSGSFTGNGAGLTNVPATSLSGTIADGQLSTNIAQLDEADTFGNPGNNFVGAFTGNGGGLTNLLATSLAGTIADTQLSTNIMRLSLPNGAVQATAGAVVVSGFVVGATILNGGSGYGTAPLVGVTDVSGSNAVITATVSNGVVVGLTVQSAGRAYSSGTVLTIAPPPSNAYQTVNSGIIFNGVSLFNNPADEFVGAFTGNGSGLTNLVAGSFTGGVFDGQLSTNIPRLYLADTAVPATAGAVIISGYIVGTVITNGGSGYPAPPLVTVTDFSGTNAVITASVANGEVTGLTVQVAGSGYSPATTLTIAPPPDNSIQTFSSPIVFSGSSAFVNPSNTFSGAYSGNGAGLTNVSAALLAGTIQLQSLPGTVVTNLATPTFTTAYFTNNYASNFFIGDGTWAPEAVPFFEPVLPNQSGVLDVLASSPNRPAWIDIGSPYNLSPNGQYLSLASVPGLYANIQAKGLGNSNGYPLIIQGPTYAPNSGNLVQSVGFFDLPDDAVTIQLKVNSAQGFDVVNNSGPIGYARMVVKNLSGAINDGLELDSFYTNYQANGVFQSNSVAIQTYKSNGLEIITRQTNAPIGFYVGGYSATNNTLNLAQNAATFSVPISSPAITSGNFFGNGGGLTNLSLPNFTSPVPDSILSSNIPRLNLANTAVTATAGVVVASGLIVGATITNGGAGYVTAPLVTVADVSGSNAVITATVVNGVVTSLAVQASGSGYSTAPSVAISPPPPGNSTQNFASANIFTGVNTFSNSGNTFMGAFIGDGSGLTNLPVVVLTATNGNGVLSTLAQLNAANNFTNPSNTFAGTFVGDGSGLTGLSTTNFNIYSNLVTQVSAGSGLTVTATTNANGTLVYSITLVPGWLTNNPALPVMLNGVIMAGGTNPAGGTFAVTNPFILEANNSSVSGPLITPVNPGQVVAVSVQPSPGALDTGAGVAQLDIYNTNNSASFSPSTNPASWLSLGVSSNSAFIATRTINGGTALPLIFSAIGITNAVSLQTNGTLAVGGYYSAGSQFQVVKSSVIGSEAGGIAIYGGTSNGANNPELFFGVVSNSPGLAFIQTAERGTTIAGAIALQPSGGKVGIGTTNPAAALGVAGGAVFSGSVTATNFIGSGAGLTNLSGFSLTGSVADSLLSTNIPRLSIPNIAVQATAGVTEVAGLVVATSITNGGAGYLTAPVVTVSDVNGSNAVVTATISNGVVTALTIRAAGGGYSSNVKLSIAPPPPTPNYQTFNSGNVFNGVSTFNNISNNFVGTFWGNGSWLTNLNPAGISNGTANINITGNAATATTAASVSGNIGDTQLSANVPLLNTGNIFTGGNTFSGTLTATNPGNVINGTFSGNGAGLTNVFASAVYGGISTNILIGGHTFFITNGLIMNIQ